MELNIKKHKRSVLIFWILFLFPFIFLTAWFWLISVGKMGYMPDFKVLENPKSNLASQVFSADGEVLGKYFRQNRTLVHFDEIAPELVNALVATEDARFYSHSGIDIRALGRVAIGLFSSSKKGGGSTISQQLAKNLFKRKNIKRFKNPLLKAFAMANIKFKEWVIAVKLEKRYTKEEIIALYLNTYDFLNLAVGIESASKVYFNTTPARLNIEQSATLVGMLQNSSFYNPLRRPDTVKHRRNVVLLQMERYGTLAPELRDSIKRLPLVLNYQKVDHNLGSATYFREYLRMALTANKPNSEKYYSRDSYLEDSIRWLEDPLYGWIAKNPKPDGKQYNLYSDGLKIYTTLDSRMQNYAEQAVEKHLKFDLQVAFDKEQKRNRKSQRPFFRELEEEDVEKIMDLTIRRSERYNVRRSAGMNREEILATFEVKTKMRVFDWNAPNYERDTIMTPYDSIRYYKQFLHTGLMSMESATGYIKAYVGDINYKHFKYNNVNQSRRQVGSTFKPFIYSLAMMPDEHSPCYKVPNIPVTFDMPEGSETPTYEPAFSSASYLKKYEGKMISLKFGLAHSMNQISAWIMKKYGPDAVVKLARKMGVTSYLPAVYSLCVGSAELRLSEIVGAYSSFSNHGVYVKPIMVTRIEDKYGNVISTFQAKKHEAVDSETAYRMVRLMQGVVDFGTSKRLRYKYKFTNPIAGKTGTTNNNSDGWFIGMVPKLITGVWVGGEERSIHFEGTLLGQGANMALPIWAYYMSAVYADPSLSVSSADFPKPATVTDTYNCSTPAQETENGIDELDDLDLN